jgi:hypothetical protein
MQRRFWQCNEAHVSGSTSILFACHHFESHHSLPVKKNVQIVKRIIRYDILKVSYVAIPLNEKKVGKERLVKAIQRATFYGAYNYTIIKNILQAGLDQVPPRKKADSRRCPSTITCADLSITNNQSPTNNQNND